LYEGKPIPMFGDGDSGRDYTYIDDIIQGVLAAIDRPFDFEVFNLGESFPVKLRQLVLLLEQVSSRTAHVEILPTQPGDVEITYADVSRARRMLGYNPSTSIEDGLGKFVGWFESFWRHS